MAYRFEFDAKSQVLLVRFSGDVSEQRIEPFYSETTTQIERTRPRAAIFDFSKVTTFDVSPGSVRSMADAPPLIPETFCPRVIVAPAKHIFAMSRMFQMRGQRSRPALSVVASMQEAWAEIGLDQPDFKPLE
jgi:hypothetical protein